MGGRHMVKGIEDKVVDSIVVIILAIVGIICIFPLMYVLSMSLTPFSEILKNGGFLVIPRKITFEAYAELLRQPHIPRAFNVTIFITLVGTIINLILTILMAYPLSRKNLPGRSFFLMYIVFTMLFNGGMIPTYLVVKNLGLINKVWAMILPNAIWTFNTLVMKSFFEGIPEELFESARIDGAGEFRVLWQILMPLSKPVLMTVGLFYMVGHWNEFFQAIMYISDKELYPMQVVVRQILTQSRNALDNVEATLPSETIQAAIVIFASIPIIVVYPFLQKYFTKGMLLGAVKG
jgi:putative aldouronate transport system permease protein